jgi:hypothetical protein
MNRGKGFAPRYRLGRAGQLIQTASQGETVIATIVGGGALIGMLLMATPAVAQLLQVPLSSPATPPKVRIIEWDTPAQFDATPGAVIVDTQGHDTNRMWFVTRLAEPHLYRLEFPKSLMKGSAKWTSWKLNAIFTGGIRRVRGSHDRRFIFVRTISSDLGEAIERVDTDPTKCPGVNCQTTVYQDTTVTGELDVSDVAVDDRNNVFSTHTPDSNPALSYVQRLTAGTNGATVTRWNVPGSGAGLCGNGTGGDISVNTPCISGIAVHPYDRNRIYFSEPASNSIAELNIYANPPTVKRWSLDALEAACKPTNMVPCRQIFGPRHLQIDRRGKVWVVTGSSDLISLEPSSNTMTIHQLPDIAMLNGADGFALAPDDDVVGYTASRTHKVGMVLPKGRTYCIPASSPVPVTKTTICNFPAVTSPSTCKSGWVCPIGKTVDAQVTPKDDGLFIEAKINTGFDDNGKPSDSFNPLGITPVKSKAQGTFFFTVGTNLTVTPFLVDRVGFVRLPVREKVKSPRDDDDENDGNGGEHKWHDWHNHAAGDADDDGFEDEQDSKTAHENVSRGDATIVQAGQAVGYPMTASATSLAIIAKAEATDSLAQIGIDILDAGGLLVARSLPTPGIAIAQVLLPAAGTYTARVRNYGALPVTHTATLITREPLVP